MAEDDETRRSHQIFGPANRLGLCHLTASRAARHPYQDDARTGACRRDGCSAAAEPTFVELLDEHPRNREPAPRRRFATATSGYYAEEMKKVGEILDKMKTIKK
jgi:hypothetical protein